MGPGRRAAGPRLLVACAGLPAVLPVRTVESVGVIEPARLVEPARVAVGPVTVARVETATVVMAVVAVVEVG